MTKKRFRELVAEIWRLRQQRDYCAAFVKAGKGGKAAKLDLRDTNKELQFACEELVEN